MLSRKAQGVTKPTLKYYRWTLQLFQDYLASQKISELEQVTPSLIRGYLVDAQNRVTLTSVRTYFRAVRAFFNFMTAEQYLTKNPVTPIKMPRAEQKVPRTFDPSEVKMILGSFDKTDFVGLRNYTMMSTLFATGLRRQELLELRIQDINFTVDLLRVRDGKGHKERFVPLGRGLRKILLAYLKQREIYLDDKYNEYVWIGIRRDKISQNGFYAVFKRLRQELSIGKERVSPHAWRHSFAKMFLLNGGDLCSLQKLLGHGDLATTRLYLNLNQEEVKLQHAKYNPLDCRDWLM